MVGWSRRAPARVLPLVMALTVLGSPSPVAAAPPPDDGLLFSLPVGPDGLHAVPARGDQPAWGPSAMTVAPDGTVWFADTVGDRVVGYSRDGRRVGVQTVRGRVVGIGDIAIRRGTIAVLDIAAARPKVVTVDRRTGATLETIVLPEQLGLRAGLSGIAFDPRGGLLLEFEGGSRTSSVDGSATRRPRHGRPVRDGRFSVEPGAPDRVRSSARISYGTARFRVSVPHQLGGVYLLGERAGTMDLIVDARSQDAAGTVRVDRIVRRYTAGGRLLGTGRVPIGGRSSYVAHDLDVAPDGSIVGLVPRPGRFDVISVGLRATVGNVLPAADGFVPESAPQGSLRGCRDRRMMDHVVYEYLNNNKFLDAGNINGACAGRMKPRYLGAAKVYPSVSYDWGGWDTATQWNGYMDDGKQAGDIDTTSQACSRGVDCSGLVSRAWGLSTKHSTWSLPNVSRVVALADLVSHDVFNDAGSHVVHWHVWGSGGLTVTEATVSNRFDRIVHRWVDDSYVNGFQPRRFNNVC